MTITITALERSPDGSRGLARDTRLRWALEEVVQRYEVRPVSFRALKGAAHLAGCGHTQQDTALLYEDLQQCIADGKVAPVTCEEGYERALLAEKNAPRYGTLAACEAEYGDVR
jgi:uncharacterized protein YgiB involved in biofilm formation